MKNAELSEIGFGSRLKRERLNLGLSPLELATLGGVGQSSQFGYESGARAPDLNYLASVQMAGVDINYVISGRSEDTLAREKLNWELHDQILEAIESWLKEEGLELPFQKKMGLLRLLMANYEEKKVVDIPNLHLSLRLVA